MALPHVKGAETVTVPNHLTSTQRGEKRCCYPGCYRQSFTRPSPLTQSYALYIEVLILTASLWVSYDHIYLTGKYPNLESLNCPVTPDEFEVNLQAQFCLTIGEMSIKTTMWYPPTPVRKTTISQTNKKTNKRWLRMQRRATFINY